jgi:hypothetical protein
MVIPPPKQVWDQTVVIGMVKQSSKGAGENLRRRQKIY